MNMVGVLPTTTDRNIFHEDSPYQSPPVGYALVALRVRTRRYPWFTSTDPQPPGSNSCLRKYPQSCPARTAAPKECKKGRVTVRMAVSLR
jgi:hypothetical protein